MEILIKEHEIGEIAMTASFLKPEEEIQLHHENLGPASGSGRNYRHSSQLITPFRFCTTWTLDNSGLHRPALRACSRAEEFLHVY